MAGEVERLPRLLLFIWLTQKPAGGAGRDWKWVGHWEGWFIPQFAVDLGTTEQPRHSRQRVRDGAYLNYAQQGNRPE